ncbi:MAG: crosslink repair DNA glycosylase YcaQ family protein, partial [Alistipes putredinis]
MLPLITLRLQNQLLVRPPFDSPQQVVEWMGAIQAQDYRMAKWAVGCRTASTDATQIEAALNRGDILRTHLLRPTWHFVSSKDLRWMLSLTADRIRAANDSYARGTDAALGDWRKVGVDADGRVVKLRLQENGLAGSISSELQQLSGL